MNTAAAPTSYPMTVLGKKLLEQELDHLVKVEREGLKTAIALARALGDLKENAEYAAAKEKQSHVEGRIAQIQGKLAKAQVVDVSKLSGTRIVFGATVTVFDHQKNKSITFQLVGEDEAQQESSATHQTKQQKISFNSPLGRALIGKSEGDEVIVKAPKGDLNYEIEEVYFTVEDNIER